MASKISRSQDFIEILGFPWDFKISQRFQDLTETSQDLTRGLTLGEILYALPEITEIIPLTEIRNHSRRYLIL